MTESTRLFWSRLALGLSGLGFALAVVFLLDSISEFGRVSAIRESLEAELDSLTCQLYGGIDSVEFWIELSDGAPIPLTLTFDGVSWRASSGNPVEWRASIPQETKLLLLYDTLLQAGVSSPDAAEKVFRVYFGEEELSAL